MALTEVITTLAEATAILVGVTTAPVEVKTTLQEVTTPLTTIPKTIMVHTEVMLPILALFLLRVQIAPLLPAAMQMLLTKVQVVVVVVACGAGGVKHQGMTFGTAGQRGAPMSSLHSRAR